MTPQFKSTQTFDPAALQDLFRSVGWSYADHPQKLAAAMRNSATVFSAWDGDKLIGLINALDDGIMTAYIHFLLVDPAYQGQGIGTELLRMAHEKYKEYIRVLLVTDEETIGFYQGNGYEHGEGTAAMFINRF